MWVIVLSWRCWLQFKSLLVLLCYYPKNNCIPQHVLHAFACLTCMSYMQLHSYLQFTQNLHHTKFIGWKVSTLHTGLVYRIAIKDAEKDILFNKEREKSLVKHFTIFLIMRGKGLWKRIHCWGRTFSHKNWLTGQCLNRNTVWVDIAQCAH